jgi:hypothetical protein
VTVDEVQKFQGGRSAMVRAAGVGIVMLAITFAWMVKDPKTTLFSYLVAFTYWVGLGLGALLLLMIFHAFHAKWMVVMRRPLEIIAAALPVFILLFIPIALGLRHLYSWTGEFPGLSHEQTEILHKKTAVWLTPVFFLVRTGLYLATAVFLGQRLFRLSTRQDETGDLALTVAQRRFSAGGLPFLAVVFAFSAFDWMMTLDPFWFSTMFGVYYFAGSFVGIISLLAVLNARVRGKDLYGDFVGPEHSHNVGKLMLAFTAFWAYIGFSQFMLIWIANLPEEIPFFTVRMRGAWAPLGVFLIFGHFFLPFFTLLSKNLKRKPARLAVVAVWLMVVNFADLVWLVTPTLSPEQFVFPLSLITAFLGVGGVAVAGAIWTIRGHFTLPVKDPFLSVSLRYRQP